MSALTTLTREYRLHAQVAESECQLGRVLSVKLDANFELDVKRMQIFQSRWMVFARLTPCVGLPTLLRSHGTFERRVSCPL